MRKECKQLMAVSEFYIPYCLANGSSVLSVYKLKLMISKKNSGKCMKEMQNAT